MTIHVTKTQQLIAHAALQAVGAPENLRDPAVVDHVIRAMLVIQEGRMQAYMLKGFNWSCNVRKRREPVNAFLDRHNLERAVEAFHLSVVGAQGEAARRIRANRARRQREAEKAAAAYKHLPAERKEQRRLRREARLANQPIEQLIA